MKYLFKYKKGDISLLVTLMVCSIMLIYLAPISQKLSVESKISRENLMSQQAIQAAKTGLEHWVYDIEERATSNVINFNFSGDDKNIPQNLTTWESLDSDLGIEYRVDFFPKNGSNPAYIVSRGRVNRNGFTIERTFEEKFDTSTPLTPPASLLNLSGNFSYTTPWGGVWYCNGGSCYRNSVEALTIIQDGPSSITLQVYASVAEGTIIKTILSNGNECGRTSLGTLNATYNGVLYVNGTNHTPYNSPGTPNVTSEQIVSDATVYQMAGAAGCVIY